MHGIYNIKESIKFGKYTMPGFFFCFDGRKDGTFPALLALSNGPHGGRTVFASLSKFQNCLEL